MWCGVAGVQERLCPHSRRRAPEKTSVLLTAMVGVGRACKKATGFVLGGPSDTELRCRPPWPTALGTFHRVLGDLICGSFDTTSCGNAHPCSFPLCHLLIAIAVS